MVTTVNTAGMTRAGPGGNDREEQAHGDKDGVDGTRVDRGAAHLTHCLIPFGESGPIPCAFAPRAQADDLAVEGQDVAQVPDAEPLAAAVVGRLAALHPSTQFPYHRDRAFKAAPGATRGNVDLAALGHGYPLT